MIVPRRRAWGASLKCRIFHQFLNSFVHLFKSRTKVEKKLLWKKVVLRQQRYITGKVCMCVCVRACVRAKNIIVVIIWMARDNQSMSERTLIE